MGSRLSSALQKKAQASDTGKCSFCLNLEKGDEPEEAKTVAGWRDEGLPAAEWLKTLANSKCRYCQIFWSCLKVLQPDFLKADNHKPDTFLKIHVAAGEGRISVFEINQGQMRAGVVLRLFSSEDTESPLSFAPIGGEISPVAGDEQSWKFLRQHLDNCLQNHAVCRASQDSSWYPERLLCIDKSGSSKSGKGGNVSIRLVLTEEHQPRTPYITLSHCWGGEQLPVTTEHNIGERKERIDYQQLPRTFQDCVTVAVKLGIEYVWIDSLCIMQDTRADWARHSRRMNQIYGNALFTLAAVSSASGLVPFLGPEAPSERSKYQSVAIDTSALRGFRSSIRARCNDALLLPSFISGPLNYRAWAFQEEYVSPRIVYFTEQEVRWRCYIHAECECGLPSNPGPTPDEKSREIRTLRSWRDKVGNYSSRNLTYASDKLPALSGVAALFHNTLQSEYLAGSWLADFPRCLSWYAREPSDVLSPPCPIRLPLDNSVPTWSWASIDRHVFWAWYFGFEDWAPGKVIEDVPLRDCAVLLKYSCNPSTENVFGEVEQGSYLEIKGKTVKATLEVDGHGCACVRRPEMKPQLVQPDCRIILEDDQASGDDQTHSDAHHGVLRRATPTDSPGSDNYKRAKGEVTCLLLFTAEWKETLQACVLILGQVSGAASSSSSSSLEGSTKETSAEQQIYQRLATGFSTPNGSAYRGRKKWFERWKGWEDLGEWEGEEWRAWFEGNNAETKTLRIV